MFVVLTYTPPVTCIESMVRVAVPVGGSGAHKARGTIHHRQARRRTVSEGCSRRHNAQNQKAQEKTAMPTLGSIMRFVAGRPR